MVVGWFSLTDQEYLNVLKHIFATTVFSENFILAKEINYFDPDVHLKPLVHMWSLSIEEQFYLLFPLIFLFRKMWGRANLVVVGVTIISIICCIISSVYFSKYTYYISISRFWEISTGCLLAINQDKIRYNARIHLILGLAGVMFIGVCVFQKSVAQDFSIYKTLFAVLGAGLIIASGLRNNSFSSFVGNLAPMTHIGKISYSLYLYHWPILSFAYILLGQRPETMTLVVLLIATYLITLLTYYTVEKPARYTKFNVSPVLFLAMLFVLGLSVLIQKGPMLKLRGVFKPIDLYSDEIGRNAAETFKPSIFGCSNQFGALVQSQKTACYQSKPNRSPDLILVGDSHAGELYGGFSNSYRANNIALVSFYRTHEDEITDAIVKTKGVRSVVFAFYWLDKLAPNPVGERFGIVLRDSINRIVRSGISVYVIDDVPTFSFLPSACKSLRFVFKRNICSESSDLFVKERSCYSKYLSDLENDFKNVKLVDIHALTDVVLLMFF